jgi:hypothetical protein
MMAPRAKNSKISYTTYERPTFLAAKFCKGSVSVFIENLGDKTAEADTVISNSLRISSTSSLD